MLWTLGQHNSRTAFSFIHLRECFWREFVTDDQLSYTAHFILLDFAISIGNINTSVYLYRVLNCLGYFLRNGHAKFILIRMSCLSFFLQWQFSHITDELTGKGPGHFGKWLLCLSTHGNSTFGGLFVHQT